MYGIAQPHDHPPLVLASTSVYRRELLQRLRLAFSVRHPQTDEAQLPGEAPREMALRLAKAKASAVACFEPGAWVIGSDQVCACEGRVLGKPGSHGAAAAQLRLLRGRDSVFHTAIALVAPDGRTQVQEVPTRVRMRLLSDMQIEAYLRADQPYDCAGSAKSESLGIALVEAISSDDPTAIVGLPLIALCDMLLAAGFPVLGSVA
ncbi:MAG: septum formation protein Maf [Proteobacteria bacterium]|nr:septum formation protein Maf [Pseudomonadota bacterium]